jgi:hypothetical protein
LRNSESRGYYWFPQYVATDRGFHCYVTMGLVMRFAYLLGNTRQTDWHEHASKVFLARGRPWRTLKTRKNGNVKSIVTGCYVWIQNTVCHVRPRQEHGPGVGFDVFTEVSIMLVLSWALAPCGFIGRCQRFGETCLHLQPWRWRQHGFTKSTYTRTKYFWFLTEFCQTIKFLSCLQCNSGRFETLKPL